MRNLLLILLLIISQNWFAQKKYVLVIHGGAGTITPEMMSPEVEKEYKNKLTEALKVGYQKINNGKTSLEAIESAIIVLEDSPLFNAGKGSVFSHDGINEMDASVMLGQNKKAGAVAGVTTIKNPIKAAIAVMQNSSHVLLSGKGAEEFAKEQKLQIVDRSYFWTEDRWNSLQKAILKEQNKTSYNGNNVFHNDYKYGTVGAVALDKFGNIAAGTSTGGMTNKKWNRIGDTPIIGAGTYANELVGVSGTGWGEFFIRSTAARTVASKMEYQNKDVVIASQEVIDEIEKMGGDGGLIALDKDGKIAMPFNTKGMYRGAVTDKGEIEVEIYK